VGHVNDRATAGNPYNTAATATSPMLITVGLLVGHAVPKKRGNRPRGRSPPDSASPDHGAERERPEDYSPGRSMSFSRASAARPPSSRASLSQPVYADSESTPFPAPGKRIPDPSVSSSGALPTKGAHGQAHGKHLPYASPRAIDYTEHYDLWACGPLLPSKPLKDAAGGHPGNHRIWKTDRPLPSQGATVWVPPWGRGRDGQPLGHDAPAAVGDRKLTALRRHIGPCSCPRPPLG
jgi:hypothetical protein